MATLHIPHRLPANLLSPDQQAGNNISAMLQLYACGMAPSVAAQVKRHITLVHAQHAELDHNLPY